MVLLMNETALLLGFLYMAGLRKEGGEIAYKDIALLILVVYRWIRNECGWSNLAIAPRKGIGALIDRREQT